MLLFENDNVVSKYSIQLDDEKRAKDLVIELTQQKKVSSDSRVEMIWTRNGNFERRSSSLTDDGIKFETLSPNSCMGEYNRGAVYRTVVSYLAPFTLSVAARVLYPQVCENVDNYSQEFLARLKARAEWRDIQLDGVVPGVNIDQLSELLASFSGEGEAFQIFLKNYHPDLFYLREFMEYIRLIKSEEFYIPAEGEVVDRALSCQIDLAKKNSNVAKKLDLTFKGR